MEPFSRRFMVKSLVAGVTLAGQSITLANAQRPMPYSKRSSTFIVHNDLPWALETRRSEFGFGPITPASHFFVRNNLPMPAAAVTGVGDSWSFDVQGCKQVGSLTLADLKRMPIETVATVLQCSGNGREFFSHDPSGSQWAVGAAGCALWTGVRVADIFEYFGGVAGDAAFLTASGGEELPEGIDKNAVVVERSVPIAKGLEDCLLVWEMNGAPLPAVHGGPLRLIVPGYFGVNNVKWVRLLAATPGESSAKIQQSGYRFRPQGASGSPEHPSMWRMPVKSWLNGPGADGEPVLAGMNTLYGVAFAGERGIQSVEVSFDLGKTWQLAELVGPDLGPNAWRTFSLQAELDVGRHRVVTRAVDTLGEQQPQQAEDNHRGYGHNGWEDHVLEIAVLKELPKIALSNEPNEERSSMVQAAPAVTVAAKPALTLSDQALLGKDLFMTKAQPGCGVCHSLEDANAQGVVGPNLNTLKPSLAQLRNAMTQGVGAMPAYGGQLSTHEVDALAAYVFEATR